MSPLLYAASAALALLTLALSPMAGAASAPNSPAIIQVELDGGHDDPDLLEDDHGMSLLSSIVVERQERANGDALDMDDLHAEIQTAFESVDSQEPELVYSVVCIDGRYYTICKFKEVIVVVDPLLEQPVSVTQITTMRLE